MLNATHIVSFACDMYTYNKETSNAFDSFYFACNVYKDKHLPSTNI